MDRFPFWLILFAAPALVLLVIAYLARPLFRLNKPFGYRVSPLNVASALILLAGIGLWIRGHNVEGENTAWAHYLMSTLFLGGGLGGLFFDALLQMYIRQPRTVCIVEGILLIPVAVFLLPIFFGLML